MLGRLLGSGFFKYRGLPCDQVLIGHFAGLCEFQQGPVALSISFFGLRHPKFGFLQVDDGIGLRIQASDTLQRGLNHFLA